MLKINDELCAACLLIGMPMIVDGAGNEFFPGGCRHVEFRTED